MYKQLLIQAFSIQQLWSDESEDCYCFDVLILPEWKMFAFFLHCFLPHSFQGRGEIATIIESRLHSTNYVVKKK